MLTGSPPSKIEILVVEREKARLQSDYDKADKIREELKLAGVELWDKDRVWRRVADGKSGPIPTFEALGNASFGLAAPMFAPLGGKGGMGAMKKQNIMAAVQNPRMAQRTMQMLGSQASSKGCGKGGQRGVNLGVKAGTINKAKVNKASAAKTGEAKEAFSFINQCMKMGRTPDDAEVTWLVGLREKVRHKKDFAAADELRTAMKEQVEIEVFDKDKYWITADGRRGAVPSFDELGLEFSG